MKMNKPPNPKILPILFGITIVLAIVLFIIYAHTFGTLIKELEKLNEQTETTHITRRG